MERPDERQIAVSLRVVEPVAHHELVRDVEPDVTDGHVDLHRLALTQQRTHGQRSGITAGEVLQQPRQGQSGVDDVLDDEHVPAGDVAVEVLQDTHDPGRRSRRTVRRHRHELQLRRDRQSASEVGHEHDRTFEYTDENEIGRRLVGRVVRRDLLGQLGDLVLDLLLGDEHGGDVALVHGQLPRTVGWHRFKTSYPCSLRASTSPGRKTPPCPRQRPTRPATDRRCSSVSSRAPPSSNQVRNTLLRTEGGTRTSTSTRSSEPSRACSATSAAIASSASQSSRSCRAVRASASATPPASTSSNNGSTSSRTRTRRNRGSVLCGSCHGLTPSSSHAAAVTDLGTSSNGLPHGGSSGRIPANDRGPDPLPSPSSTVSAWSSRVCPNSTSASSPACSRNAA